LERPLPAVPASPAALPFALELSGRGGAVRAADVRLSEVGDVEELSIRLPHMGPQADLSRGPRGFRHHRGRLEALQVVVAVHRLQSELETRLQAARGLLAEPRVHLAGGDLVLRGRVRLGEHEAHALWRARLVPAGDAGADALLLSVYDAHLFGWLPRSSLALTHDLLGLLPDELVRRRALTHALLVPLRPLLKQILVPRGWKLPAHGAAVATMAMATGDGLRLRFEGGAFGGHSVVAVEALPDPAERSRHERFVRDFELKRHHARPDALIGDGGIDAAVRELRRRIEAGGDREFLEGRLLQLLVARDVTLDAAAELAERRVALAPDARDACLALAAVCERRGETERAVEVLERLARDLDPLRDGLDLELTLLYEARLLEAERARRRDTPVGPDRAEAVLRRLLSLRPDSGEALGALAARLEARGAVDEAIRLRARLLAADVPPARQAEAALAIARHHVERGRPADALPYLALLEDRGAEDEARTDLLIAVRTQEGRHDEVARLLEARLSAALAAGDEGGARAAAPKLAIALAERLGRARDAAAVLESVLERFGGDAAALAHVAELYRRAGDPVRASALAEAALDRAGGSPAGRTLATALQTAIALDHSATGDVARARARFGQALDGTPDHAPALDGLEALAKTPADWDEVVARLHAALDACGDPERSADLALRLALIYARTFDFPGEAVPLLERALTLRPDDRFALRHLVELTRQLGDWERHHAALERSIGLSRSRGEKAALLVALADVETDRMRRPAAARVHLELVLRERPRDDDALARLGRVLHVLGDHAALAAVLRKRAALAGSGDERQRLLLELAEIQLDRLGRPTEAEATLAAVPAGGAAGERLIALRERVAAALRGGGRAPEAERAAFELVPDERDELKRAFGELARTVSPRGELHRTAPDPLPAVAAPAPPPAGSAPAPVPAATGVAPAEAPSAVGSVGPARPPAPRERPAPAAPAVPRSPWFAALAAADRGDSEQAIALLEAALERDPADRPAWELLATLLDGAGDREGARTALLALETIDGRAAPPAVAPAAAVVPVRAAAPLTTPAAASAAPADDVQRPARLHAAALAAAARRPAGPEAPPDAAAWARVEESVAASARALREGDGTAARAAAEDALRVDPDCHEAWEALAAACAALGDRAGRAQALAERAERAWSADEGVALNRQAAEALMAAGDMARAEVFYRRYLRWAPLDDEVFLLLAESARQGARHPDLRRLLEERVEALGRLRSEGGDESLGVALSLARTELAALHEDVEGDTAAAIRQLEQARRDWPHNDEALERLAGLLEADEAWSRLADVLEALVGVTEDRALRGQRLARLVALYRGPLNDPVAARETLRVALRELPPKEAAALRRALEGDA
jgi:tetratricopeptide (TPR) repeat protein